MPNELLSISKNIRENEDMSKHTTFKAGGRARMFAEPESDEELAKIIRYCKENKLRYYIIGNGSDLLVSDKGYEGLILSTLKLKKIRLLEDNIVEAHAGTLMRRLACKGVGAFIQIQ